MSDKDQFRNHPNPHVLPADRESDDLDGAVPLEDYDYGPEWDELVERMGEPEKRAIPDGGEVDPDRDVVDDQDDGDDEPVNQFECPATGCDEILEGKPTSCPSCGASYQW